MDFIVPLMMLMALSVSKKFPGLLKILIILGVGVNFLGLTWITDLWNTGLLHFLIKN